MGLGIFMPAFGLLGIDFGYGFDHLLDKPSERYGNPLYNWPAILKLIIFGSAFSCKILNL
jgi:hypothetical protein